MPELKNDLFVVHILAFVKCLKRSVEDRRNPQLARIRGINLRQVMRLQQSLLKLHKVKANEEIKDEIESMVSAFRDN